MDFWPAITQKNAKNETCPVKIDRVEAEMQAYTHTHTHTHIHTYIFQKPCILIPNTSKNNYNMFLQQLKKAKVLARFIIRDAESFQLVFKVLFPSTGTNLIGRKTREPSYFGCRKWIMKEEVRYYVNLRMWNSPPPLSLSLSLLLSLSKRFLHCSNTQLIWFEVKAKHYTRTHILQLVQWQKQHCEIRTQRSFVKHARIRSVCCYEIVTRVSDCFYSRLSYPGFVMCMVWIFSYIRIGRWGVYWWVIDFLSAARDQLPK